MFSISVGTLQTHRNLLHPRAIPPAGLRQTRFVVRERASAHSFGTEHEQGWGFEIPQSISARLEKRVADTHGGFTPLTLILGLLSEERLSPPARAKISATAFGRAHLWVWMIQSWWNSISAT